MLVAAVQPQVTVSLCWCQLLGLCSRQTWCRWGARVHHQQTSIWTSQQVEEHMGLTGGTGIGAGAPDRQRRLHEHVYAHEYGECSQSVAPGIFCLPAQEEEQGALCSASASDQPCWCPLCVTGTCAHLHFCVCLKMKKHCPQSGPNSPLIESIIKCLKQFTGEEESKTDSVRSRFKLCMHFRFLNGMKKNRAQ